ncbi:hypothetical protein APHAL10511_006307 [Amanita phalloides]|nr:hypothetical protein APHAL10511_006307 [Amanita phalloides]
MSEYLPRDSAGHEPTSPTSPTSPASRPKKFNPLNDLIDTERLYVEQLTGVIRRIAAAWSRTNLPPLELDTMFRSIEAVYKANKSLYSRLKDIGTNPSSPKVLGDLLMKWITDLDTPYTNYCTNYCSGFDDWEPVKSNHKLPEVLKAFTASFPLSSSMQTLWTLDAVFLLPKGRLKYYRKLYNRLLKGTVAGRSDHRLLVNALEKLDALLNTLESRQSIRVGQSNSLTKETEDEVVVDLRTQSVLNNIENSAAEKFGQPMPSSVDQNIPQETNVPKGKIPAALRDTLPSEPETNSISVRNLEIRLSTARTLDIFTMNPKAVRLQFSPNNLTFTREMRLSLDVSIQFTPRVTNTEVIHRRGHVFILSDLFLICERMTPQEKAQRVSGAEDMWLCYPPLAGKVLRIAEVDGQSHALQITVMKKESLFVETDSIDTRNALIGHLRECIEFSGSLPPPSKELPPPVPPLNVPPDKNTIRLNPDRQRSTPLNRDSALTSARDISRYSHQQETLPRSSYDAVARDNELTNRMSNLASGPDAQLRGAQRIPSVHNSAPGPTYQGPTLRPQDYHTKSVPIRNVSPPVQNFANSQSVPLLGGPPTNFNQSDRPREQGAFLRYGQPLSQQQTSSVMTQPGMHRTDGSPHRRPPSESGISQGAMRKSTSMHSLASHFSHQEHFQPHPPIPSHPKNGSQAIPRTGSMGNIRMVGNRPLLPSAQISSRDCLLAEPSFDDPSPPGSPAVEPTQDFGPVTSTISAEMKCKVFLQQQHAQWKSFGSAKLKLYCQSPTNIKQLVVASNKSVLISTIVLTDGVERVGKTGVAIELSDKGARTGVVYMLQLQNETSAATLFDSLLAGSDRSR